MSSVIEICNRGLQKLGANRITSLTDGSSNAQECAAIYDSRRDTLLRRHPWNFATKRAVLTSSATPPTFGYLFSFPLPHNYLKILSPDEFYNFPDQDWKIEGTNLLSSRTRTPSVIANTPTSGTFYLKYTARIEDPNLMDPLFREVFSTDIALELCERLTQSNDKKQGLKDDMKDIYAEARRANAWDSRPANAEEDTFITVRV